MNQLISDGDDCRTALATPGMLIIKLNASLGQTMQYFSNSILQKSTSMMQAIVHCDLF